MNRILIFCIYVIPLFTYSQNIKNYYYWINQAELAITDSNWHHADVCYDSAFTYKKPFARDLLMAYGINVLRIHNNEKILKYARERLLCGDYDISDSYSRNKYCDSSIIIKLKNMEDTVKSRCNKEIQDLLDTILNRDQQFHYLKVSPKEHRIAYKKNKNDIKRLYRDYLNVDEYMAGIYYMSYLLVPVVHYIQKGDYSLLRILKKETKKGNIDAYWYMELVDNWTKNKTTCYGLNCFYMIDSVLFLDKPDNVRIINKNRLKLGISESFEEYVGKVFYQCQNGDFVLKSINKRNYTSNKDEIERLKKEIDKEHQEGNFRRMYYESSKNSD